MIYKFKVWAWLPMTTEVHLSAIDDEDANKIFNKIDLAKGFNWKDDGMHKSRVTYEVTNVQNRDQSISSSRKSGEKS
jgi:hypothetical protein